LLGGCGLLREAGSEDRKKLTWCEHSRREAGGIHDGLLWRRELGLG
jgi:hypothetical protein